MEILVTVAFLSYSSDHIQVSQVRLWDKQDYGETLIKAVAHMLQKYKKLISNY